MSCEMGADIQVPSTFAAPLKESACSLADPPGPSLESTRPPQGDRRPDLAPPAPQAAIGSAGGRPQDQRKFGNRPPRKQSESMKLRRPKITGAELVTLSTGLAGGLQPSSMSRTVLGSARSDRAPTRPSTISVEVPWEDQ